MSAIGEILYQIFERNIDAEIKENLHGLGFGRNLAETSYRLVLICLKCVPQSSKKTSLGHDMY